VELEGDVVRISVRDHGAGIPAEFRQHIFEKFAQADATSSRREGGTGLGLSIVKQIVERLGGHVSFGDAAGGGSIFCVELPVWHAKRPRILHVDDDHDVLAVVSDALRLMADVMSVDSLEAARFALKTELIDLAVLDVAIGADSGLDLLPYLRDGGGRLIPVIIFANGTGQACTEQIENVLPKTHGSLEDLATTVRDRLALLPACPQREVA
jgi:CheY-like chemotaxis protein